MPTPPTNDNLEFTKEEALQGLDNPILSALQDNNLCQSDIAQTIAKIFLKLKTEADKKKINLKRLITVSKEARPWADILLKLYDAYPADKQDLTHHIDQNIMSMMVELVQKDKKETTKPQTPSNDE